MAEGIRKRHSRKCRSTTGAKCSCKPSYEAFVFLSREGKKLRKTFPTEAAAKTWRADAVGAAARGRLREPTKKTLEQAAEELIAGMKAGTIPARGGTRYKPGAVRGYEAALRQRIIPSLGGRRLAEIRRSDVQDLVDRLMVQGLAKSTIENTLDPLRVVYRRAMMREEVATDPTKLLEISGPKTKRDRIADPQEAKALLAALPEEDRALWATAMYAGLRRGELRALRWRDIDLAERRIHVCRGWDEQEGEQKGKTAAADRRVPILRVLGPELAKLHLRSADSRPDALVFGTTADRPFSPTTIRGRALKAWGWQPERDDVTGATTLKQVRENALKPISLHEARHTTASVLIAAGANAKVIQTVMGHATIGMTFDTYGHLMPGGLDEAAELADAYIEQATG